MAGVTGNTEDPEVGQVSPYEGPRIRFSHIDPDDSGLRPYQAEMKHSSYDRWDRADNVMLQMPTGTGKTVVFCSIIEDIRQWCLNNSPGSHIVIIAHRRELIDQAGSKLAERKISHGTIQGSTPQNLGLMVQVASIQTFMSARNYERLHRIPFDFIIIDEAHHSMAASYRKLWDMYPNSKKLGVTATPWRMSHSGFTALFSELVLAPPVKWFIEEGYLSDYEYYSVQDSSDIQRRINSINRFGADGDFIESELSSLLDIGHIRAELYKSYEKYAAGKKGIIYAIDRKHAANIRDLYASHGVSIEMIDGTTPKDERSSMIDAFRRGDISVLVNVNIFSEGFDCPDIEFVQLARPTRSLSMFLQQVGRALRPAKGKQKAIILDNVGLYNRFGTPDVNRRWKHHFLGMEQVGGDTPGFNDGTEFDAGFELVEYEPDYSEGTEEMVLVNRAARSAQAMATAPGKRETGLRDYNIIRKNGLYGVCNRHKRIIIQPIYEDMRPYFNGLIPFRQNGKWGIMYGNGKIAVKPKYYNIGPFTDGLAEVQNTKDSPPYKINGKMHRVSS